MSGLNRVLVIGNLGQKPELKYFGAGNAVCNMSIAVNETWTDKQGKKQEHVEWIRCVAFNKLAEICGERLDKGRQVCVEGKMVTKKWKDKESGDLRYMTEVHAQNVQFLGGGEKGNDERSDRNSSSNRSGGDDSEWGPPPDDDIPF